MALRILRPRNTHKTIRCFLYGSLLGAGREVKEGEGAVNGFIRTDWSIRTDRQGKARPAVPGNPILRDCLIAPQPPDLLRSQPTDPSKPSAHILASSSPRGARRGETGRTGKGTGIFPAGRFWSRGEGLDDVSLGTREARKFNRRKGINRKKKKRWVDLASCLYTA